MKDKLKQARLDHKDPAPGDDIALEDMGGGEFTITPSKQHVINPTTLEGMQAEAESLVMLLAQDDGGSEVEGVMVFHPVLGGIGLLPAKDYSLFNSLLLNLVLRTGHYGCCKARVEVEKGKPVVRLDLARYEICYNRCQQVLHELGAGAQYVEE